MGACFFLAKACPNTANAFVFWHFISNRAGFAGYSEDEIAAGYIKLAPKFFDAMVHNQEGK